MNYTKMINLIEQGTREVLEQHKSEDNDKENKAPTTASVDMTQEESLLTKKLEDMQASLEGLQPQLQTQQQPQYNNNHQQYYHQNHQQQAQYHQPYNNYGSPNCRRNYCPRHHNFYQHNQQQNNDQHNF
eukprot:96916-Ditylum_brightwellii.AAC.1